MMTYEKEKLLEEWKAKVKNVSIMTEKEFSDEEIDDMKIQIMEFKEFTKEFKKLSDEKLSRLEFIDSLISIRERLNDLKKFKMELVKIDVQTCKHYDIVLKMIKMCNDNIILNDQIKSYRKEV